MWPLSSALHEAAILLCLNANDVITDNKHNLLFFIHLRCLIQTRPYHKGNQITQEYEND